MLKHFFLLLSIVIIVIVTLKYNSISSNATTTFSTKTTNLKGSLDPPQKSQQSYPHIIFMMIDDQGYADMGYNSIDLKQCTPNLDKLANTGIKLQNYYSLHICTPARAALLTGLYPIHNGLYHEVIHPTQITGLSLSIPILPQYLKEIGYGTHAIGKWHLGYFSTDYTPTSRGFDSFYGFYGDQEFYIEHKNELTSYYDNGTEYYYDFVLNNEARFDDKGTLSTDLFERRTRLLIESQDVSQPMFLYLSWQNVHGPLEQVPTNYFDSDQLSLLESLDLDYHRRVFAELTIALDNSVGRIIDYLKESNLYDNSIIIVASDNGGCPKDGGYGYPFRGRKHTLFEAGSRVNAFIHSPLLSEDVQGTTYDNLFHVSDWLPTIIAGMIGEDDLLENATLDGVNHWPVLTKEDNYIPRTEMIYNIDKYDDLNLYDGTLENRSLPIAAIRVGDYKYMTGEQESGWFWPKRLFDNDFASIKNYSSITKEVADCQRNASDDARYLFNLALDPYELYNLYDSEPEIVAIMEARLMEYMDSMVEVTWAKEDSSAYLSWNANGYAISPWINL